MAVVESGVEAHRGKGDTGFGHLLRDAGDRSCFRRTGTIHGFCRLGYSMRGIFVLFKYI